MALGTITRTGVGSDTIFGNKRIKIRDIQLTSGANYTTGGETVTPAMVGLRKIDQVLTDAGGKNATGTFAVPVRYDYTASKLQAYRYNGASAGVAFLEEVGAATDLSTFSVRATFIGY